MSNIVFIATSLDGYIADKNGGLDWLQSVPNPEGNDMGFHDHMERVDALVMGRNTLEIVLSFDVDWPYSKPVFVLSNTMKDVPKGYEDKIFLVRGELNEVLASIHQQGFKTLYIDGGVTIQNFLKQDLIDEMNISTMPVLLGGGASLFGELVEPMNFELVKSEVLLNQVVQNTYQRKRS